MWQQNNIPTIPEYFKGKNILVTGGTGFLGKVLIEKLLRSCPDIGKVYMLVRNKKGKSPEERLQDITNEAIFNVLKEKNPRALEKIVIVPGDITQPKLGISKEDENALIANVNVIYHSAASVRLHDPLRTAVLYNTLSTREIVLIAQRCKRLEVFTHISTAYCNADKDVIEEKFYPAPASWQDVIELAQSDQDIEVFSPLYVRPLPNTYTFTKRLAEEVARDLCKSKIPLVVIRPSIVIQSLIEPIPGWIDNLRGPFALCIAGIMGISSTFAGKKVTYLDAVMVDNAVKGMIISTWKKALSNDKEEASFYNACSELKWKMQWCEKYVSKFRGITLFEYCIWHFDVTINRWNMFHFRILFHVLIGMILDAIMKWKGEKLRVTRVLRTLLAGTHAIYFVVTGNFVFRTEKYDRLESHLLDSDRKEFEGHSLCPKMEDERGAVDTMEIGITGIKRYVLKEKYPPPARLHSRHRRMLIAKHVVNYVIVAVVVYWILTKWVI